MTLSERAGVPPEFSRPALAIAVLALAACALSGCATGDQEARQQAEQPVKRLLGQPLAAAVELLGPDYRSEAGEGGAARHTWVLSEEVLVPGNAGPPTLGVSQYGTGTYTAGRRAAPRVVRQVCRLTVEIAPGGLISGWTAEGQDCAEVLRARVR